MGSEAHVHAWGEWHAYPSSLWHSVSPFRLYRQCTVPHCVAAQKRRPAVPEFLVQSDEGECWSEVIVHREGAVSSPPVALGAVQVEESDSSGGFSSGNQPGSPYRDDLDGEFPDGASLPGEYEGEVEPSGSRAPVTSQLDLSTGTAGALGELIVSAELFKLGYNVFRALSPACPYDLIAEFGRVLYRVEVRTGWVQGLTGPVIGSGVNCGWDTQDKERAADILAVVTHSPTMVTFLDPRFASSPTLMAVWMPGRK